MCGIVGYVGSRETVPVLLEGLQKLEYRGYDSAGLAVISQGKLELRRSEGKLTRLVERIAQENLRSTSGIGHTRWATHGRPNEDNAHPHTNQAKTLAVVHNGIIENDRALRRDLEKAGVVFSSATDSEILAHLIDRNYLSGTPLEQAVLKAIACIQGTFALGVISQREPQKIVAVRRGSPLILGLGQGEYFLASDTPALLNYTRDVMYLEEDELAVLEPGGLVIMNFKSKQVRRKPVHITWNAIQAEKSGYKHFMLKEIFEQPQVVEDTLRGRVQGTSGEVSLGEAELSKTFLKQCRRIFIIGCGTSWHAGLVGKFLLEQMSGIPTEVDFASEFRYRTPLLDPSSLVILISQSGETADTLAALREAKARKATTLAVCNVLGSTMTREADATLYTHAGPEIGVASTKAFTAQLTALHLLAVYLGQRRGELSLAHSIGHLDELRKLPGQIEKALKQNEVIQEIAGQIFQKRDFLYLGRGINYPIALEGALKLKEISYIHAEGYPAGEMKHGPIALIDGQLPVVAILTKSSVLEKMISNVQEVKSRNGAVLAVANRGSKLGESFADWMIEVPSVAETLSPIINIIPLQLLAYHVAVQRGADVDQPRNLAKSVTVE